MSPPEKQPPRSRSFNRSLVLIFAICIPLIVIFRNPSMFLMVMGGASLAIAGLWLFGRSKVEVGASTEEIADLKKTIDDLQERLENVEVINRFEQTLAERSLQEAGASEGERAVGTGVAKEEEEPRKDS